jgi:hypothetical protein
MREEQVGLGSSWRMFGTSAASSFMHHGTSSHCTPFPAWMPAIGDLVLIDFFILTRSNTGRHVGGQQLEGHLIVIFAKKGLYQSSFLVLAIFLYSNLSIEEIQVLYNVIYPFCTNDFSLTMICVKCH